jgi:hypothetical protein
MRSRPIVPYEFACIAMARDPQAKTFTCARELDAARVAAASAKIAVLGQAMAVSFNAAFDPLWLVSPGQSASLIKVN